MALLPLLLRLPAASLLLACALAPCQTNGFIGELWKAAFGGGAVSLQTTPVALGIRVGRDFAQTLISRNATVPVKRSYTYEASCDEHGALDVGVFAGHGSRLDEHYELGNVEVSVPCITEKVAVDMTLEVDVSGKLSVSLQDNRDGARLFMRRPFPNYGKLIALLAPVDEELHGARGALDKLRRELHAERLESAELSSKVAELERQTEAQGKELWTVLREATTSDRELQRARDSNTAIRAELAAVRGKYADLSARAVKLEAELLARRRELREASQRDSASRRNLEKGKAKLAEERDLLAKRAQALLKEIGASERMAQERGDELWKVLREASEMEKASEEARVELEAARAEVAELGARVESLLAEAASRGAELAACFTSVHHEDAQETTTTEQAAARALLTATSQELLERRLEARLWSVVASLALVALTVLGFRSRRASELGEEGDCKKERRKLLRLLARVRQSTDGATCPPPEKVPTLEAVWELMHAAFVWLTTTARASMGRRPQDPDEGPTYSVQHDEEGVRRVLVRCPGTETGDVQIHVFFNGAEVRIDRSRLVRTGPAVWSTRFHFAVDEGHFEFSGKETRLENGLLEITFRAVATPDYVFSFPKLYDMTYEDAACSDMDLDQALFLDPHAAVIDNGAPAASR